MKKLLLLLCAGLTISAADQKIVGGPYVVNTTARGATIVWLVQTGEAKVQTGTDAPVTSPSFHVEKTTLTGLLSNHTYTYNVTGDASGKGSFKTPPTQTTPGPYNFVVYGDNRSRHDVHRKVVDTLVKGGIPDFVLQTGDMVLDGTDDSLWPIFFDVERTLLRQTTIFPSLGNHERNSHDFYDFFQSPGDYYSFDWGNGHFIVMNTDIDNMSRSASERAAKWAAETKWLEEDLQSHQSADFRIITGHQPPYTAVASRQGDNPHMTALVPMFEKYHVNAAFFGHDHNYQHYLKNGIHYVVAGGGGAPLYDVDKPPVGITQKVAKIENFVRISVNGKVAKAQAIDIDGKVLDEFQLQGGGSK